MAINGIAQYTNIIVDSSPTDILLFTPAPILVWLDGTIIDVSLVLSSELCTTVFMFSYDWWLCMVINISAQYNGGFLLAIILLTHGYYHC